MKATCTCGFILISPNGNWLIIHPTGAGNRWDIPKGKSEPGEAALDAAIRELHEETGLVLSDIMDISKISDFGRHSYNKEKDLHLFVGFVDQIDTSTMSCSTLVHRTTHSFPEVDNWKWVTPSEAMTLFCPRLNTYITKNVDII